VAVIRAADGDLVEGDPEASSAKFRALVTRMGGSDALVIDDVVSEIYGLPFSDDKPDTGSLEWRFLAWLHGGK